MQIRMVKNISNIIKIHNQIFIDPFPCEKYKKKIKESNKVVVNEIWKDDILVGYVIYVKYLLEKRLHLWLGGFLPQYQGQGLLPRYIQWLKNEYKKTEYEYITSNTDNYKPNVIRMFIKLGFIIDSVEQTSYGDGRKIMFRYDIQPKRSIRLSITNNCNMSCFFCHGEGVSIMERVCMTIPQIENILVQCKLLGVSEITITGGEPLICKEQVRFILSYCESWMEKPYIKIVTNGYLLNDDIIKAIQNYSGKKTINVSLHTIYQEKVRSIYCNDFKIEKVFKNINKLLINGIDVRINITILKGINETSNDIREIIEFLFKNKIQKVNFMELLVLKEQEYMHSRYVSSENIEKNFLESVTEGFALKKIHNSNKKIVYKLKRDGQFLCVGIYRLSCRCGCNECINNNDITIGADGRGYPCYLEPSRSRGNAFESVKELISEIEEFDSNREDKFGKNKLYWG